MKPAKGKLDSFDPAERARAGQELVRDDLAHNAKPLLAHLENEFDDRVVAAIAHAVVAAPPERRESRRVSELRAWAAAELERLALEDRFFAVGRDAAANNRTPQPVDRKAQAPASPHHISWRAPG